jgi:hypothetical protein
MAQHRTRKQKETTNYQFLVSWQPKASSQARVNRESALIEKEPKLKTVPAKRAYLLAKDEALYGNKKDILKSLILVSFILILEVVVYLALHR